MIDSNGPVTSSASPHGTRQRVPSRFVTRLVLVAMLAMSALIVAPGTALGASAVTLTFQPIPAATIGQDVFVLATIHAVSAPTPAQTVELFVNDARVARASADAKGVLSFRIPYENIPKAGSYALRAQFTPASSRTYLPARATGTLKVAAAKIKVVTVPALAGVPISLGATTAKTGPDGTVTLTATQIGSGIPLEAHVDQLADPAIRASFIRWGDGVYAVKRQIPVKGDASFVLGLRTAYKASVQFKDENGNVVDPKSINRAAFTSSTGQDLVLTNFAEPAWWEAGTAVSRTGGLQPSTTLWRLSEVVMAGTNVVNQGQQAFTPTINGSWTINLLLYDLTIRTNDAVTGGGMAGTAELVFPDSSSKVVPIRPDGTAEFDGLPRGSYLVRLKTDGIAPPTPIALSRTQGATIRVISYFDIAAAVILALVALFVLLWIGRRRHVRALMWAAAAPGRAVRRLPLFRAPNAARRQLPVARSAMAATMSDVARVGRGPGADAVRFVRDLFGSLGRSVARAVGRIAHALTPSKPSGVRVRRAPADGPSPAWPAAEPRAEVTPTLRPAVASRPVGASLEPGRPVAARASGTWFDAPTDDEGPTHDCSRCGRAVPDSARFCRSCGYQQF